MNKKLESIKPYIKFYLQHSLGQPVKDIGVDTICNKGKMVCVANVGEGYALVSEVSLIKKYEFDIRNYGGEQ